MPTGKTRRDFVLLTASALATIGAGFAAWPFIASMTPSSDSIAKSVVSVNLSKIKPGQNVKVAWRTTRVCISRRTSDQIQAAKQLELNSLHDPQIDADRVKTGKDEWFVFIGLCTVEGCPVDNTDRDQSLQPGWRCRCCGSVYDSSGRAYIGPAKKNLLIPDYRFTNDLEIEIL